MELQLLLIEDDATIAHELRLHWQQRRWQVQWGRSLAVARTLLAAQPGFDLLVLDLGLPDGDGLQLLAELRQSRPQLPVLVLTARDTVADKVAGLRQGADDYLVKPFATPELDARIDSLLRRSRVVRGQRLRVGELEWIADDGVATLAGQPLDLSPREFEVLGLLAARSPRLCPKPALLAALFESNMEINDSAVEVYISRLRRRLQGSRVSIRTLRGFGYVLEAEAGS